MTVHRTITNGVKDFTFASIVAVVGILLLSTLSTTPTVSISAGEPLVATQASFAVSSAEALKFGVGGVTILLDAVILLWAAAVNGR